MVDTLRPAICGFIPCHLPSARMCLACFGAHLLYYLLIPTWASIGGYCEYYKR